MKRFYSNDFPDDRQRWDHLAEHTQFDKFKTLARPKRAHTDIMAFRMQDVDLDLLRDSIEEALTIYGDHGWMTSQGEDMGYTGFSLVYNPDHQEKVDPNASTLGTSKNRQDEFFWASSHHHDRLKDSYFDTLGFTESTPASRHGYLGKFMDRCLRQRVRSRVSVIHGDRHIPERVDVAGWHKDEIIWQNLRINIPVTTSDVMKFQFENKQPVHLDVGWAYSFDSYVPHRVFSSAPDDCKRIHIVLGFSPWFDYDSTERCWYPNRYFGRKHPFDMLIDGEIFEGLEYDDKKVIR